MQNAQLEVQERQADAQRQAQQQSQERQIYAAQQSQAADQAYHAIMQERQWTYADTVKQQERQNALVAIEEAVGDGTNGTLTPEEAMPMILRIKTGLDLNKQRQEKAEAEFKQARVKQVMEQAGLENSVLASNLKRQAKSSYDNAELDPQAELLERDGLKPKYQALAAVIGAEAAQAAMEKEVRDNVVRKGKYRVQTGVTAHGTAEYKDLTPPGSAGKKETDVGGEWSHLGTQGRYDEVKGAKDAEAYAKHIFPVDEETKVVDGKSVKTDKNKAEREALARRRQEGTRQEFNAARKGSAAATSDASGQAQAANDQRDQSVPIAQRIADATLDPFERQAATEADKEIKAIMAKPNPTAADVARVQTLRQFLGQALK